MSSENLIRRVAEAFGKADLRPLFDVLDDDIVWKSAATQKDRPFRFGGTYAGKANVIELLSRLSTAYFFNRLTTKEIISSGEIFWGLFDAEGVYSPIDEPEPSAKPIRFELAMRMRVREGKILEVSSFFDTAYLLAQQHESPRD